MAERKKKVKQALNVDELVGGWFPQANRSKLAELITAHDVTSVIEIGSFLGLSAIWFALRTHRVQCIDPWRELSQEANGNNLVNTLRRFGIPRDFLRVFLGNVLEFGLAHKVTPIVGYSQDVHMHVVNADLVYIDGDHSYEACKRDIELYGPKARKIICGDDYVEYEDFGVIAAVREMLPEHEHADTFWWYVKPYDTEGTDKDDSRRD